MLAGILRDGGTVSISGMVSAMVIYAFVSGVVVSASKETVMWKAILLGAGAPALIFNAAGAIDRPEPGPQSMMLVQSSVVHAATQDAPRSRVLSVDADEVVFESAHIYIADGSDGPEHEVKRDRSGDWMVPTGELAIVFRGKTSDQVSVETPWATIPSGSDPIVLRLYLAEPKQTFVGGLLQGLGFERSARQHLRSDANVEVVRASTGGQEQTPDGDQPTKTDRDGGPRP